MSSFEIREYLKIKNTNDKAAYAVRMLQEYIRNLRSYAVITDLKLENLEIKAEGHKLSCGKREFDNTAINAEHPWTLNDDFLGPITVFFNGIDDTVNPGLFTLTEEKTEEDVVTFKIHYSCSPAYGAKLGFLYWERFLETFDCEEFRECVEYKCIEIFGDVDYNPCVTINGYNGDIYLYVYNREKNGYVDPAEWNGKFEPCDKWSSFFANADDYTETHNWLFDEVEWSQEALEKWEPEFKKFGAETDRYFEVPGEGDDEDCKYLYQGLSIINNNLTNENINDFVALFGEYVKYLRGFATDKEKIDGYCARCIIGEFGDNYYFYVLDDSDRNFDGVKIFRAVL